MTEHAVIVDNLGGTTVLSCEALQIKNIEYPHREVTTDGVKETILKHKFLKEENCNFDIVIIDNRPEPEDYHKVKAEEQQSQRNRKDKLFTSKDIKP